MPNNTSQKFPLKFELTDKKYTRLGQLSVVAAVILYGISTLVTGGSVWGQIFGVSLSLVLMIIAAIFLIKGSGTIELVLTEESLEFPRRFGQDQVLEFADLEAIVELRRDSPKTKGDSPAGLALASQDLDMKIQLEQFKDARKFREFRLGLLNALRNTEAGRQVITRSRML